MLHIIVKAAVIFVPIRASEDARSVVLALLKFSLVEFSAFICYYSLAMRQIFKKLTYVLYPVFVYDCPSDLLIFVPFS
jgi:hypothetical protein